MQVDVFVEMVEMEIVQQIARSVHLWLTFLSKWSKWRLSNKSRGVARAWIVHQMRRSGTRLGTTPFNTTWYDAL